MGWDGMEMYWGIEMEGRGGFSLKVWLWGEGGGEDVLVSPWK